MAIIQNCTTNYFLKNRNVPCNMNSVIFTKMRTTSVACNPIFLFVFFLSFFHFPSDIIAEGSKDFVNYPGKRLFLDTRDNQQMKVYAAAGEFINLGSSHIGIQGGFIDVYRPDGTFHSRFENANLDNTGIIFNNTQESNGPTGNVSGYKPGVVSVDASNEGIWTVVFDFPGETDATYANIDNNAPWTRSVDQPNVQRVILAWDITVSQNAAANQGGNMLTGRVYSNKYVSEILNNGNQTSPTFYILSRDGYSYRVDFNDIDPFRFTVGSNSFGIVNGEQAPTYQSVTVGNYTVSDNPSTWAADQLYLYQLMAEDYEALINNKVFFNPPAGDLPASSLVTDIFAETPNTHTTWLSNSAIFNPSINFTNFNFVGFDQDGIQCDPNTTQTGIGGFAVFDTNLGGTTILELDLNGDGDFEDDIDRRLFTFVEAGTDSIFWDGNDGLGNPLPIQEGYTISYNITVRGGEIHIPIIDVENNPGGVTFNLINENGVPVQTDFFYDNTTVGGDVSGGGTGEPQPTNVPFTYDNNFGNNKILDYWTYIPFTGDGTGTFTIDISEDCVCQEDNTPVVSLTTNSNVYCQNSEEVTLTASVDAPSTDLIYLTYSFGNDVIHLDTIMGGQNSSLNLGLSSPNISGSYSVIAENERGCVSEPASANVIVVSNPSIGAFVIDNASICAGETVLLSTSLSNAGSNYTFEVIAPDNSTIIPDVVQPGIDLILSFENLTQTGDYSLSITNTNGCVNSSNFNITVNPNPAVSSFFQNVPNVICEGDSISISGNASLAGTYTLTLPDNSDVEGTLDDSNGFSYIINEISEETNGEYSLVVETAEGCVSEASSINVAAAVAPTQLINLNGAGAYCEGDEVTLTTMNSIEGVGSLTYTITGGQTAFEQTVNNTETVNLTIPSFSTADAGEYTLIVEGDCQIDTLPFLLVETSAFEYSGVTGGGTYCEDEDIMLSANGNLSEEVTVSYTWSGPNYEFTATAPGSGPFPAVIEGVHPSNVGTFTLSLSSTDFDCELGETSLEINVNERPVIENVIGGGAYCQLTPISFSAENTNTNLETVTYTWLAPDGFEFSDTVNGDEPLSFETDELNDNWSGIWSLIVVSEQACAADTITIDVVIDPAPVIFSLDGGGTYCAGETAVLSAFNGNPNVDVVVWTWENQNGIFAEGTVETTTPFSTTLENISVQDTGLYVLLLSSENECPVGVGTFNIYVENAPIVDITAGDATVCPGEDVTLIGTNTADFTGEITYTWSGPNGFMQTGIADENDEYVAVLSNVDANNAGEYTLTLSTANGCTAEVPGTAQVTVIDNAVEANILADTDLACNEGSVTFTGSGLTVDGAIYEWFYDNNGDITSLGTGMDNTFTISPFTFSNEGEYFVVVTTPCNTTASSSPIFIETISGVDAFEDEAVTEPETSVTLNVMDNDLMGNNTGINYQIIIAPANGTAEFNSDESITYTPNAEFSGLDSLQYQICSDVCQDICDLAWVYITVNPPIDEDCFYPNFFSPNGDESNPTFFIDCLEEENLYPDNNIVIFNRWGDEVYSAAPYQNDWVGDLDGNGTELPAGTYFYILNLTPDGANCKQGYITIIK